MRELPTLSHKQKNVLVFIKQYMDQHQAAPAVKEISQHFRHTSLSVSSHYLNQLECKGFIQRNRRYARSIALTDRGLKCLEHIIMPSPSTLPFLGTVQAGPDGILNFNDTTESIEVQSSICQENRYVLNVQGDSMIQAHIQEGDYVVVEKVDTLPLNQIVIVLLNDDAYIKRLIRENDGTLILRSENPRYQDIVVRPEDRFSIKGKVVHLFRTL